MASHRMAGFFTMTDLNLVPPYDVVALLNRNNLQFDPRVMDVLEAYFQTNLNMVSVVTLGSQAEYDALTTEQKNDPYKIYTVPV